MKKNKKNSDENIEATASENIINEKNNSDLDVPDLKKPKRKKLKITLGAIIIFIIALAIAYKVVIRPPDINSGGLATPNVSAPPINTSSAEDYGTPPDQTSAGRKAYCYTFLLAGIDEYTSGANTDTIMVGMLNTKERTLNIVSIPRDTLVNVPWRTKKINSIYSAATDDNFNGKTGPDALMYGVKQLLGYNPDCYMFVDLEAFQKLVDSVGGIWFDVPQNMYYDDPTQHLTIAIEKGYQLLNGYDAMGVVRYRHDYVWGDIDRIKVQQAFLSAAASQLLTISNVTKIKEWSKIFDEYVTTNLSLSNIIWFGQQMSKLSSEDITFDRIPANDSPLIGANQTSYVSIYQDRWLELINAKLNPFYQSIDKTNIDLLIWDEANNRAVTTGGVIVPASAIA